MTKANIEALTKQFPLLAALIDLEEVCWFNPPYHFLGGRLTSCRVR